MLNLSHKKLDVWKDSVELIKLIYKQTKNFPREKVYGISNQLRRASVSIASNIAEGCSRISVLEKKRFFEISRSSLVEVDTQLIICSELSYLSEEELRGFNEILNKLFAKLSNLIIKFKL